MKNNDTQFITGKSVTRKSVCETSAYHTGYKRIRRSLLVRIAQRSLDLLQHILLLVAFLMFFSYIQVATATEQNDEIVSVTKDNLLLLGSQRDQYQGVQIPLKAQTGTDIWLKLLVGLICASLAVFVRAILFRFYSGLCGRRRGLAG